MEPLAYILRPTRLEDIVGQNHLVGPNGLITKMVKKGKVPSLILYGGPGIGKTTIAYTICLELNVPFFTFNASTDNKATLKKYIEESQKNTILIVDEIHRMKKDIQDYLLPHVENGNVTIIGLTTINPYHSVNPAVRSRTSIFKLNALKNEDLEKIFVKAAAKIKLRFTKEAQEYLINMANGEARSLINMLETISMATNENDEVDYELSHELIQKSVVNIDKNEDSYFDTLSGLQKSIRGSDVNAALHYLAKLLIADDLLSLTRRLYAIYYEDISIANPNLGPRVRAACEAALELGMPEARLPFASIVVDMALSPKSNSTYIGISKALEDIEKGNSGSLPLHLKNTYSFDPNQGTYKYPHDFPGAWVDQQYLPDPIKDHVYYIPKTTSQYELALKERYDAINKAKGKK